MGASRWFFTLSGCILIVGALALATKQLNLGIDFESGTRVEVALIKPTDEEGVREALDGAGVSERRGAAGDQSRPRRQRLPDPVQDAGAEPDQQGAEGTGRRIRDRRQRLRQHQRRPDLRRNGGEQRPQRADLLAADHLRLHRLQVRPEVRGAGPDRALPRHPDHRGRLLAYRPGGERAERSPLSSPSSVTRSTTRSSSSTEYARTCRECRGLRSRRSSTAR